MRWRNIIDPALMFLVLALVWERAVDLFQIKAYLLPPLSKVAATAWSSRAVLLHEGWITLLEIVQGFAWAMVGGVVLGVLVSEWPTARRTLYPLIVAFQGLPKIALAPLMVIWVGYGSASKVLMAFLFAFFPVVISTLGGLSSHASGAGRALQGHGGVAVDDVPSPAGARGAPHRPRRSEDRDAARGDRRDRRRVRRL